MAALDPNHISILDPQNPADAEALEELLRDPAVNTVDTWADQFAALAELRPAPTSDLLDEPARWVYYPWRAAVLKLLGPRSYRRLRLDRNRHLATSGEQDRLGRLRIGIVGLSSGHLIAHSLAVAGFCGELRLTDFDALGVSNLNRIPATVFDIGLNKATAAMRRIAELDPYLAVRYSTAGLSAESLAPFLDGLDVLVEQCDSLEMKLHLRHGARARGIPVLMATSDRGLIDVERFDIDPSRPVFHGLLGDIDPETMAGLPIAEKLPYLMQVFDPAGVSPRMGASLLEVGRTLSAWPQLVGDVTVGAATVLEAIRRIGLDEPLASGRTQVDIGGLLGELAEPTRPTAPADADVPTSGAVSTGLGQVVDAAVAAAIRAPSGGNSQPWHIAAAADGLAIGIDPERTSAMDIGFRGSAVAVGAAAFNARVAAAANGFATDVTYTEPDGAHPLQVALRLRPGAAPELARWYPGVFERETNRHRGTGAPLAPEVAGTLSRVAQQYDARAHVMVDHDEIAHVATVFADADRIRYLTPTLHREMISELRWPGDDLDFGIDVRSLGLGSGDLAVLPLLRRTDVVAALDDWDAGTVLGDDTRDRMRSSSAVVTVLTRGAALSDLARGGAAMVAVWMAAQAAGLAVQPMSPPFLYAHTGTELGELSSKYADELRRLQGTFNTLISKGQDETVVLALRISAAPRASVPSRRSTAFEVGAG
ncbi:Rv1355c family protein [Mycolicibacterium mucogenicum]|uniref:Rv1355c family protein n=1 Tax=Mycolicibacterium mucogenicum TaxID=56689 RepID=UPI002269BC45|nr:Rv1355c family protein [Mycolicibacterium mucogenicum]MCX8560893.1 Rv1355c family protein [Mycolicibacterium mucogenicum]